VKNCKNALGVENKIDKKLNKIIEVRKKISKFIKEQKEKDES